MRKTSWLKPEQSSCCVFTIIYLQNGDSNAKKKKCLPQPIIFHPCIKSQFFLTLSLLHPHYPHTHFFNPRQFFLISPQDAAFQKLSAGYPPILLFPRTNHAIQKGSCWTPVAWQRQTDPKVSSPPPFSVAATANSRKSQCKVLEAKSPPKVGHKAVGHDGKRWKQTAQNSRCADE